MLFEIIWCSFLLLLWVMLFGEWWYFLIWVVRVLLFGVLKLLLIMCLIWFRMVWLKWI